MNRRSPHTVSTGERARIQHRIESMTPQLTTPEQKIESALHDLVKQRDDIVQQKARLDARITFLRSAVAKPTAQTSATTIRKPATPAKKATNWAPTETRERHEHSERPKRTMSAQAKRRIAAAAKRRWAAHRAQMAGKTAKSK